ncbi:hypothetical protein B6U90_03080 [Thermoplasmatales archaeon ex4484_6]|nr:MAG: hypothetical protein B6U90_03080 [Thermoplasmatales archaeon ex4484_6]RLF68391.1 MAG: hypothetical protein DRN57_04165 [Thermoplasmata archaeon]
MVFRMLLISTMMEIVLAVSASHVFWRFWKKSSRKIEETQTVKEQPAPKPEDQPLVTDFMVSGESGEEKENGAGETVPEKIYRPGGGSEPAAGELFDPDTGSDDHLMGHDVEVKELPEPEPEELDPTWVKLDVSRDHKHILEELDKKNKNCYEILGIPASATTELIKKTYRKLASEYHPDRVRDGIGEDELRERIREINFSKEILLDPVLRALHDQRMREREGSDPGRTEQGEGGIDTTMIEQFPHSVKDDGEGRGNVAYFTDDDEENGLGVLLFGKWEENRENFTKEFFDHVIQLDDAGYIDYGEVLKGDVSDMDEISRLKKVSNFSQSANNTLLDVWVLPPFYYMAVPVLDREHIQEICEIWKDYFDLETIFFTYPRL